MNFVETSGTIWIRAWSAWCKDYFSLWQSWWGDFFISTYEIQDCKKKEYSVQVEEIVLWAKIIFKSVWYKCFDSFIRGKRYKRSYYDSCVYYNKLPGEEYVYLLLYVDDMFIASRS